MKRIVCLSLLFTSVVWGMDQKETPLYKHLLEQACSLLDQREQLVGSLIDPASLEQRRDWVRKTILEMLGPFPEKTPLNAKTVWSKDFGDHRIEGVIYESRPGFFVTANLYLPTKGNPPYPAVLGPCGHSKLAKAEAAYQTCWINLARRGFVVLTFDPIGQGERMSYLDEEGKDRFWGTTEHTILGVQSLLLGYSYAREVIWDGIRSIDYLESRPEVDKTRIGCSGNSGGGTQTAYFMAVDRRIGCAAPSCYITSLRRLFSTIGPQDAEQNLIGQVGRGVDHADYVEACLPHPVLICCASNDFFDIQGTWETFRETKNFYGRYGFPERVDLIEAPDKHGYTKPRRTAVYHWMARWLKGELDEEPEPYTETKPPEDLLCTQTGQVLTSLSGAVRLPDIYLKEARDLKSSREEKISQDKEAWKRSLLETCHIQIPDKQDWSRRPSKQNDARIRRSAYACEIEPGFRLRVQFLKPVSASQAQPILWVEDALAREDSGISSPEDLVLSGHPVLVVTPRGLEREDRLEGSELNRYCGEWQTAFLANHIDRPLLGQRVEDILAAAGLLKDEFPNRKIRLVARREAVQPALIAAVFDDSLGPITLEEMLVSWESVFAASHSVDVLSNAAPGILRVADIPDLVRALASRKVEIVSARRPEGDLLSVEELGQVYPDNSTPAREKVLPKKKTQ